MNTNQLRSGLLVKTRNETIMLCVYSKSLGYFFVTNDGSAVNMSLYDDDLTRNDNNDAFDIMVIVEPKQLDGETTAGLALENWAELFDRSELVWSRPMETKSQEPETSKDLNRTAEFRVKTWIEINGKEVDVNNLSPYEAKLLVSLGLMPPSILEENRELARGPVTQKSSDSEDWYDDDDYDDDDYDDDEPW